MRCLAPISVPNRWYGLPGELSRIFVPCGRCEACLESKRSSWYIRFKEEEKVSSSSIFVTLTYEDGYLPNDLSLKKKELQDFLKRLRSKLSHPIRYFACGEYCPTSGRPHYHLVVWNLSKSHTPIIEAAWQGRGFITVRDVIDNRLRYLAGYVIGKMDYPKGREPPFALMSKGLGKSYLTESVKFWHREGGTARFHYDKKPLPRYYKDKIYTSDEKKLFSSICEKQAEKDFTALCDLVGGERNAYRRSYLMTQQYKARMGKRKKNRTIFNDCLMVEAAPLHHGAAASEKLSKSQNFTFEPNEEFEL